MVRRVRQIPFDFAEWGPDAPGTGTDMSTTETPSPPQEPVPGADPDPGGDPVPPGPSTPAPPPANPAGE